jgi:hypothetical protein
MEVLQVLQSQREYWNLVELTYDTITLSLQLHVLVPLQLTSCLVLTRTPTSEN